MCDGFRYELLGVSFSFTARHSLGFVKPSKSKSTLGIRKSWDNYAIRSTNQDYLMVARVL